MVYTYYYVGSQLARMTYGDYVLDFFYDINGTPIAMRQGYASSNNYTVYYYITNLQGDVIRLVDVNGNTAAYYEYDPYGNAIKASGSHANINPLRYRGYVYDTESGFYYLQSRYYDPELGRFLNADALVSTGQGLLGNNMFAYCGNNPVNWSDSLGLKPFREAMLREAGGNAITVIEVGVGEAISLTTYHDKYYLDVFITFTGDVDPNYLAQGIESYWQGTYVHNGNTFELYVNVHIGNSGDGHSINVISYDAYGRSYCTWDPEAWKHTKESTIVLYSSYYTTVDCNWTIAHEIGHSFGVGDYYTQKAQPGYDALFPSIMNLPGKHANSSDAFMVISALICNVRQEW